MAMFMCQKIHTTLRTITKVPNTKCWKPTCTADVRLFIWYQAMFCTCCNTRLSKYSYDTVQYCQRYQNKMLTANMHSGWCQGRHEVVRWRLGGVCVCDRARVCVCMCVCVVWKMQNWCVVHVFVCVHVQTHMWARICMYVFCVFCLRADVLL